MKSCWLSREFPRNLATLSVFLDQLDQSLAKSQSELSSRNRKMKILMLSVVVPSNQNSWKKTKTTEFPNRAS